MSVAASLLGRSIVVYDDRDRRTGLPGVMTLVLPGCDAPFTVISKVQARELLSKNDSTLWVHLTPCHYTMLKRNE